jgi:hypothetical protein
VLTPKAAALPLPADWRDPFLAAIRAAPTPAEARAAVAALAG